MAGMKIAPFNRKHDGFLRVSSITDNDRMTLETFTTIYKGRSATDQEVRDAKIAFVPEGFGVWRRNDGSMWAIRNEN